MPVALAILLVGFAAGLGAQSTLPIPFQQTGQPQFGSLSDTQSGRYRICAPSEYGDPTADCIPASRQSTSSMYDFTDLGRLDPSIDLSGSSRFPFEDQVTRRQANSTLPVQPTYIQKESPTEFQRYVADSLGQMLPIFGASLFEEVPATFAPLDRSPVSSDYTIAPGDELQIVIWGQFNLARRIVVNRAGQILVPDAGPVSVSGMNCAQAALVIRTALSHFYKSFDVSVTLGSLHSIQIFVVGEARRPGSYTVSALSTLVNAVFASGGPSSRGSMRTIELKRGNQTIRRFDLYRLLLQGDKSEDASLQPGDVILIPPAGPRIAIAGSVEHPGIYEVEPRTTLEEALQLADGLSPLALSKEVVLERIANGSAIQTHRVSLHGDDLRSELHNGDILYVSPMVQRFRNTVTLRGNVASPGRFSWKPGMRLSELIPDKESLLTRDYWKGQNRLGTAEEPIAAVAETFSESLNRTSVTGNGNSVEKASGTLLSEKNTSPIAGAVFQEQKRDTQADTSLGASIGLDNLPPIRTFNPRYTVQPFAPEINWDYAVIERINPVTLSTRILPFNLGKLVISHDGTQDLELYPGDVVTVFSKADFAIPRAHQPIQVRIEGEIAMAGIYTAFPGETLRQIVARAGGLTSNAYLYGAQFTRESTRREQQKRYDEFLDQLERQMNGAASNLSSRVTSPQQALTAQVSLSSQRELLERLRRTPLNGRIVLTMEPNSRGVDSLPDLPLENGDRLYVPSRPSTVNVIGDVLEQASFVYQDDYRTGDYLKEAGGAARSADRSHMFVIRADGSVVSRRAAPGLFAKSFDALHMSPGDTLIVPTAINKTTFVRGLIDWSTIVSNFGLGAAAVNVLR